MFLKECDDSIKAILSKQSKLTYDYRAGRLRQSSAKTMIQQLLLAFAIFSTQVAFSQNSLLRGRIIDDSSCEPIAFASIALMGTTTGTACNDNGNFELSIPSKNLKIYVSSIGYLSKAFNADSLLAVKDVVLKMQSDEKLLDEIVITSDQAKPTEILQDALANISKNYFTRGFNIEAYSTLVNYDSSTRKRFELENILFGYYDGYKPGGQKKFKIVEKRESGTDPLKSINFKYWPSFELYNVDLITSASAKGIFNPEHWDKFKFKQQDITLYDQDTVFVIEYDLPKPTEKVTGFGISPKFYRGKVYIALNNYAIVRHTLETTSFRMDIIYKKLHGYYFPYLVKGTREQVLKIKGEKQTIVNTNTIVINNIMLTNPKLIDAKENEWESSSVKFNQAYWDAHHPR